MSQSCSKTTQEDQTFGFREIKNQELSEIVGSCRSDAENKELKKKVHRIQSSQMYIFKYVFFRHVKYVRWWTET